MGLLYDDDDERQLPLLGHLDELRTRLIRGGIAVIIGVVIGFFLAPLAIDLLLKPIQRSGLVATDVRTMHLTVREDGTVHSSDFDKFQQEDAGTILTLGAIEFRAEGTGTVLARLEAPNRAGVVYLKPMDPLIVHLKATLFLGVLLASPLLLWELIAFVAPGLRRDERHAVAPLFFGALFLFPTGAAFAYFMLKYAMMFFAAYASDAAYLFNDIRAYLNLAMMMMLAFGVVFELPVFLLLLIRLGVVRVQTLATRRKHIFVLLLIFSAIATPTGDPFTLAALALPLYFLFEASLIIGRGYERKREDAPEPDPDPGSA